MKVFLAASKVTRDARPLLLAANAALKLEAAVVQSATKLREFFVLHVKPDFIVPVNARMMDPFARDEVNHGTGSVIAQEAVRQGDLRGMSAEVSSEGKPSLLRQRRVLSSVEEVLAASAVPRGVIVNVLVK